MKERFCPVCGKKTEELYDGLCKKCIKERGEWVEIPDSINVEICKKCGRKKTDEWKSAGMENILKEKIKDKITTKGEVQEIDISPDKEKEEMKLRVCFCKEGLRIREEATVLLNIKQTVCEDCKRIGTGYFEALVQIRAEEEMIEEILEDCKKIIDKKSGKESIVSKANVKNEGIDLYMYSNSAAKDVARKLADRYGAERKDSKTLRGLKDGQKTYISTYLVRFHGSGLE